MIALVVTCTRCGVEYTPEPKDLLRASWRTCPACQDQPPPAAPADQPRESTPPSRRAQKGVPA